MRQQLPLHHVPRCGVVGHQRRGPEYMRLIGKRAKMLQGAIEGEQQQKRQDAPAAVPEAQLRLPSMEG